jgi:hypothetical protein
MISSDVFVFQDKILQSTGRGHNVTVTNDGATILKSLHVDNPAAKVLVGASSLAMPCRSLAESYITFRKCLPRF